MIFPKTVKLTISTIFMVLLLVFAGNVSAQEGYQGQQMMPQPGASVEVSDAQLNQVADAYIEISEIRESFQESLAGVTDPEKAQQLQEEAGEAMVQAVENNGLDVQTYNEVMEAAQVDEQLRNNLLGKLEERQ